MGPAGNRPRTFLNSLSVAAMWIYANHYGVALWKTFQSWSFDFSWARRTPEWITRCFFFLFFLQGTLNPDRERKLTAQWIPPFAFHLLSFLGATVLSNLFLPSSHAKKASQFWSASHFFVMQSLLFKCIIQLWATSLLQNWTFTFPALPLSLHLSFTIPLSCLVSHSFLFVL